ncbi:MAG TPA: hypothetical protein VLQ91_16135, partial [Draconibacterium sp.]|nr:hypothetical protein [Draconibacterium sp.]
MKQITTLLLRNLQRITIIFVSLLIFSCTSNDKYDFSTDYLKISVDRKGYITSMKNTTVNPSREFSPSDKPSPLMSLFDGDKKVYYEPVKAIYNKADKLITLTFSNNSVARVSLLPQQKYLKLTLLSLEPRKDIEGIQWGLYHTNITNLLGEIIGVARDTSDAVNYAIGMLALDDNTLGGTSETVADAAPFQYIIHTPDTVRYPLP